MIGVRVAQPDAANRQGRHALQPKAQALGQLPALPETALRQFASNASIADMATLTIRNLPDDVYDRLRLRAAENRRSMEAEARDLVATGLARSTPSTEAAVRRMHAMIAKLPKKNRENLSVDKFLAERRAMGDEEE